MTILTESDEPQMLKNFIDIVERPEKGKAVRNIVIVEYDKTSGQVKNINWAHYRQIETSDLAGLTHHIRLQYDDEGSPLKGRASIWDHHNAPSETVFKWDNLHSALYEEKAMEWAMWETWVHQIIANNRPAI